MTYCKDFAPLLSAFVDGELSPAEREQVLAHLDECEACRKYLEELAAMHAAFGEFDEAEVPAGFAAGVMARAKQDAGTAKKAVRRRRFAPLAACAALFLFVGITTVPWLNAVEKSAAAPQAPAMSAESAAVSEEAAPAPAAPAPESAEEPFNYTEMSVSFAHGLLDQDSAAGEAAPAAPAESDAATGTLSAEDLATVRLNAYMLHGMSADSFLKGWGSKVAEDLYCIDPAKLEALPIGLSLSEEDAARLREDPAPFVYVIAAEVAQ